MLNDMIWRKTPCDIINNPKIRSIAMRIRNDLRQAVFAFYTAIYMEADDDGVVDLSDKEVFADQLLLEDEKDIDLLIEKFTSKGYIENLKGGIYLITDWENPNFTATNNGTRKAETQEARRDRVKEYFKNKKSKSQSPAPDANKNTSLVKEALDESENQKKFTDVATKNEKLSQHIEREIERDREKDTHTQEKESARETESENTADGENAEPEERADIAESPDESTDIKEIAEQAVNTEDLVNAGQEAQTLPEVLEEDSSQKALTMLEIKQIQKEYEIPDTVAARLIALRSQSDWKVAQIYYTFFKRSNPTLYNDEVQLDIIQQLILDTGQCAEPKNPPHIIAAQLCTQFDNLVNQRGAFSSGYQYFKGMALTPKLMRSPSVWPRIWAEVYKTLSPGKTAAEKLETTLKRWADEVTSEKTIYGDPNFFNEQMLKKGVDPNTKGAMMAFLAKIAAEQKMRKRE